ncbi:MAG: hypothetical protein N2258_04005 [Brevinematales bacterium]|nr:hypothetical protein [Brevinematales bacterium]
MNYKFFVVFLTSFIVIACSQTPSATGSGSGGGTSSSSSSSSAGPIVENVNLTSSFFLAKGTDVGGSGTLTNIGGKDCVMINATAVADGGNYAVEAQWNLSQSLNMSGENFIMDFDIYVEPASINYRQGVQFAFYEVPSYTPIYSGWWASSITGGSWINRQALVKVKTDSNPLNGFIDYAPFANNPDDWTNMSKVRIQFVANAAANITFYIGKIVVSNK